MAKKSTRITVGVKKRTIEGRKTVEAMLEAPEELFFAADILASKGAVRRLDSILKESVRSAALSYIESAEECLKEIKTQRTLRNGATGD